MSDKGAEIFVKLVMYVVGVFLLLISFVILPFMIWIHSVRQQRRRDALAAKAQEIGLAFDHEHLKQTQREFLFLDKLVGRGSGKGQFSLNTIQGEVDGHSVTCFDYHYLSDAKVWWWSPSWERHCYFSFIVLKLGKNFPELTLAREGPFSRIAQAFGSQDIDFESREFSRRYIVRSKDKKFAYDFCNAKMIDYLLDQPVVSIEVEGPVIALGFDSHYDAKRAGSYIKHLTTMRTLMPDYLFVDQ